MAATEPGSIQTRSDFDNNPRGWAARWTVEFAAARSFLKKWHESADLCVKAFLDQRAVMANEEKERHVNLFWANVLTQMALMYGKMPEVDVSRRYNDAKDQQARIAGPIILQRLLNTDIERDEDGYRKALRHALCDYLIVGFCNARVRYTAEFEEQDAAERMEEETTKGVDDDRDEGAEGELGPEGDEPVLEKRVDSEDILTDYIYWKDQLWSPSRTFEEWRWWAYRTLMSRDEVQKRFGRRIAQSVPYNAKSIRYTDEEVSNNDVFSRVEVWEVWNKEDKKVYWFVEGFNEILDVREDPYQLRGFWPFPEPLMANLTTLAALPKPDYALAQDLYQEVNELSTRIGLLLKALKVAGVYDKRNEPIQRLLTEGRENILIPVERWDALAEKGGIKGVVDWFPTEQVVSALEQLRNQRQESMQILYQVTGQSDLMRGETMGDQSATEAAAKTRYGSARVQYRQDEFARFASGLQQLRAELISKLYDPATIIKRSNVLMTNDAQEAMDAVRMLKSEFPSYRIVVRPEALAQQDFAALQNERTQFLTAFSSLMRDAAPAVQQLGPMAGLVIGELVKWAIAGFRGAKEVEGILDKAIQQMQQQMQQGGSPGAQQPPSPEVLKMQAQQQKAQLDLQKETLKHQMDLQRIAAETAAEGQRQEMQTRANAQQALATENIKLSAEQQRAAIRAREHALMPRRPGEELL